jgi:predicted acylesterase/phospholipase RssA
VADAVTPWSRCCLRHADRVVLVGRAGYDPRVSAMERALVWREDESGPGTHRPKDLVILHPNSTRLPSGTAHWLVGRKLSSHHHIRSDDDDDYGRFARFLAGQMVGLVLGGGGARGLAHLGVIRALEEANIPIDVIGGTSQGAFMAGLYAMTRSSRAMYDPAKQFCSIFTLFGILTGLTLPILGWFHGGTFTKAIQRVFGHLKIEDLWIRYFCVTTNITLNDMAVYHRGSLWRYCRASMSVLGYLPPVIDSHGDILLDGGYVDNLPVDVMSMWANPRFVIAVDVEDKDDSAVRDVVNYGTSVSGWYILWLKLIRSKRAVTFSQILIWLSCINHSRQIRAVKDELIDLYIRPPVERFQLMDYLKMDEIIEVGYQHAKRTIETWRRQRETERLNRLAQELSRSEHRASLGGPPGHEDSEHELPVLGGALPQSSAALVSLAPLGGDPSSVDFASSVAEDAGGRPWQSHSATHAASFTAAMRRNKSSALMDPARFASDSIAVTKRSAPLVRRQSLVDLAELARAQQNEARERERERDRDRERKVAEV